MIAPAPPLDVLQLGMGWFPQQAGGLNRYFQDLIGALPGAGISPHALVAGDPQPQIDDPVTIAADRSARLPRRLLAFRRATARAMRDVRPSLIASHFALYGAAAPRPADLPRVVHFHGPWADECRREGESSLGHRLKTQLERHAYRGAERYIVLSQAFQDVLINTYRVAPERVEVIPGGVDTQRFHPADGREAARRQMGWPTDRPIVLAVRRLVPRMGLDRLLQAFARVARHHPDALLIIAGRGPLLEPLRQLAQALGLDNHVRFTGYLPDEDLPAANRAADLAVVPTESLEGFGLITLEALASGTPVLVTPVGGLPEVVRPFAPELVFADGEPATLASHLTEALSQPAWLPSPEACATYARDGFAWPVIAGRIAQLYRDVAAEGPTP